MPYVYLHTNVKESALKEGIELRIAQCVAETLGKPLERIIVIIAPGLRLLHKGSTEPACTLQIYSLKVFDAERNPRYGPPLRKVLTEELNIDGDRCGIMYHDLDPNFLG